jgi:hypothetical protein
MLTNTSMQQLHRMHPTTNTPDLLLRDAPTHLLQIVPVSSSRLNLYYSQMQAQLVPPTCPHCSHALHVFVPGRPVDMLGQDVSDVMLRLDFRDDQLSLRDSVCTHSPLTPICRPLPAQRLDAILRAALESVFICIPLFTPMSTFKLFPPEPIVATSIIPQNSDSPDDNATVSCLAVHLDTMVPKHNDSPEVDLLVPLRPVKAVPDQTTNGNFWNLYSITTPPFSLTYLARLFAALQSCSSGFDMNLKISFVAN